MTPIILDIETFPLDDAEQYLTPLPELAPPDLDAITPGANLVKEDAILRDLERRRAKATAEHKEAIAAQQAKWQSMIDECALDVDLGRAVCIGWMFASDTEPRVLTCWNEADERFALEQVARDYAAVTNPQLVTFSGLRFDLPFLMRRALYLGVRFPIWNLDRYKTPHLDLQAYLSHNGLLKWRSLKFYLNRFGIASDDMTTGAEIGAMVKAGDWAGVKAHCAADVLGTKKLAQRLGLIEVTQPAVAEGVF
jgi:hypothetical protein